LILSRFVKEDIYKEVWNPEEEEQLDCLARIVKNRDPKSIGINISSMFALGDGLTHSEYLQLAAVIGDKYMARTKSAERLAVGWLERRIKPEIDAYSGIVEIAHAIIAEAFSSRVIHPGITTTEDVIWWMRQKILDLGLHAWFQPSVSIQAPGQSAPKIGERLEGERKLILPGDLLHCDMGIYYLGLATDTQQNAYVLKLDEYEAPEGLNTALETANRLQDIFAGEFIAGRTGNQILVSALDKAKGKGINASIYTHPLGYHGHAAGPIIGLWDREGIVPGRGDYELFDNTCYALELNIKQKVPEWGNQEVRIALEEDVVFTEGVMQWLAGRQTKFYLIGSQRKSDSRAKS
jgi:hypothetical protein